jgi:hypothetical protein
MWSPSFKLPNQNPVCNSPLPYTCFMPYQSQSSSFDHPNDIWCGVQNTEFLFMYSSPLHSYFVLLWPNYSPQHPIHVSSYLFIVYCLLTLKFVNKNSEIPVNICWGWWGIFHNVFLHFSINS